MSAKKRFVCHQHAGRAAAAGLPGRQSLGCGGGLAVSPFRHRWDIAHSLWLTPHHPGPSGVCGLLEAVFTSGNYMMAFL